jgi:outer membrane protein TolC
VIERERATIMQQHQQALESLAAALQQLTARGEAATYDVRRHQAEVQLHARLLGAAHARASAAELRLAYWLGTPVGSASLASSALLLAPLSAQSAGPHPEVVALQGMAEAAASERRAASRRWIPEPELFAGYRQIAAGDQVGHGLSVGFTVPLTFLEHGQGAAARAQAERTAADARARRLSRQLDIERAAATASLRSLKAVLARAEQTALEVQQLKESARLLYAAGESSISELLDAYRTSESASLDRITALDELLSARLAVMRAAGRQFDAELDASCGGTLSRNR